MELSLKDENILIDFLPAMIWISQTGKSELFMNNAWIEFIGNNKLTLLNIKSLEKLIYKDDINAYIQIKNDAMSNNRPFYVEYRIINADDTYHWVSTAANPIIKDNQCEGYISFTIDIDTNVKIKKLLIESEQLYRKLFDAMSDPVILFEVETKRIIDINPAAIKKYGYSRFEFLTLSVYDITSQKDISNNYIKNKETYSPLRYHKNKDGFIFPVEISSSYFKINNKEFSVNIIRDTIDRTK